MGYPFVDDDDDGGGSGRRRRRTLISRSMGKFGWGSGSGWCGHFTTTDTHEGFFLTPAIRMTPMSMKERKKGTLFRPGKRPAQASVGCVRRGLRGLVGWVGGEGGK